MPFRRALVAGADLDVVGFEVEPDPVAQGEFFDEGRRQLQPPGPVEHRVLLGHVLLCPVGTDPGRAPHLGRGTAVADRDCPPHLRGDGGIVGDHDDRHAELGVDALQRTEHLGAGRLVQLSGRFVGEEHLRVVGHRDRDRHPLLLAAAHLVRSPPGAVRDADQIEQLVRAAAGLAPAACARPAASAARRSPARSGTAAGCARSAARRTPPSTAGSSAAASARVPAGRTGRPGPRRQSARPVRTGC